MFLMITKSLYKMSGEKEGDRGRKDSRYHESSSNLNFASIVGTFFRVGLRIVGILALIGILIFISYVGYKQVSSGNLEANTKQVSVALDEKINTGWFSSWWDNLMHPEKAMTYQSIVEQNEDNLNLGVKIINFEGTPQEYFFREGQMPVISATAVIEASSLSGDYSNIHFFCDLEDFSGNMEVLPSNYSYAGDGNVRRETVFCRSSNNGKMELGDKTLNTKILKFKALFETTTLAHYDAYVINPDVNLIDQNDPWTYYLGSRPKLLDFRNVMISSTTPGPVNLGMGTQTSQPFLEGKSIPFQVSLTPKWKGELKYVKDLILRIPPEIELEEDPLFCDFEFTGEYDGDYKIYGLTEYALRNKVNIDCSAETIKGSGLSERSCINNFNTNINLQCFLNILPFSEGSSNFYLIPIEAELDYVFSLEKSALISIRKMEGSQTGEDNPCVYYSTEEECLNKKGCKPTYEENSFLECVLCESNNCGNYKTEEECNLDPCKLNNCVFDSGNCKTITIT